MMNYKIVVVAMMMLVSGLLSACGGDDTFFQERQWNTLDIKLETRPHPIRAGHNEFLLHLTRMIKGAHLATGAVVRYRLHPQDDWIEAMPDGMSDVFRRALDVRNPASAKLYVHLRFHGKNTVMIFNLADKDGSKE